MSLVIRETRTSSKSKKIQTDNEQHNSHTDPCTGYVSR